MVFARGPPYPNNKNGARVRSTRQDVMLLFSLVFITLLITGPVLVNKVDD